MAENPKTEALPAPPDDGEQDTEGHNMMISPTLGRDLARGRDADIERAARERQRQKEAQKRR